MFPLIVGTWGMEYRATSARTPSVVTLPTPPFVVQQPTCCFLVLFGELGPCVEEAGTVWPVWKQLACCRGWEGCIGMQASGVVVVGDPQGLGKAHGCLHLVRLALVACSG